MRTPYFPMYPADFEAKTSHLTLEEDGAYNRLLRLCWMTPGCSLPDDAAWIARRMRVSSADFDRVVRPLLDEFFKREKGRVFSPFLDACIDEYRRKTPRPAIPLQVQRLVRERDGDVCRYCGGDSGPFHLDHVIPWSRGGEHDEENLVVSCAACNWAKGDNTPEEMGWSL